MFCRTCWEDRHSVFFIRGAYTGNPRSRWSYGSNRACSRARSVLRVTSSSVITSEGVTTAPNIAGSFWILYRGQKKKSYGWTLSSSPWSRYAPSPITCSTTFPLQFCFRHSDAALISHVIHVATDNHFGLVDVRQRARWGIEQLAEVTKRRVVLPWSFVTSFCGITVR
jgi:hypothetical protein